MKKYLIAAVALTMVLGICGVFAIVARGADEGAMGQKAPATQSLYVCPNCDTVAMKAGKCSMCGKDMQQMHLLGVKDGKATVCTCGPDCTCDAKGIKDGKCACGKPVKEVSLKGMYVCGCPGGNCCIMISDKPGKCACGMEMKKVE